VRIGIDVGGTKIEGVALGDDGRELSRHRLATPVEYRAVLEAIASLVKRLEAEVGGKGTVGVGTPGILQPGRGVMLNSNLQCLNGHPLDRDLVAAVGRPVRLANDAKCFVLSEAIDGAARRPADLPADRPDVVFGATLGTGVGGGIVVDGRVLLGVNGAAAEWSHTTLPFLRDDERSPYACPCGHPGCIESFTSGRGLAGAYREVSGRDITAPEVSERAGSGDPAAEAALASTRIAWRAPWPASSTSSIRAWSCWAAASPTTCGCSKTSPGSGSATRSPRTYARGWSPPATATPAASAAPPASGRPEPGKNRRSTSAK